jgi:hypothetical protein
MKIKLMQFQLENEMEKKSDICASLLCAEHFYGKIHGRIKYKSKKDRSTSLKYTCASGF